MVLAVGGLAESRRLVAAAAAACFNAGAWLGFQTFVARSFAHFPLSVWSVRRELPPPLRTFETRSSYVESRLLFS